MLVVVQYFDDVSTRTDLSRRLPSKIMHPQHQQQQVSLDSRVRDIINNNIKKPTSNIFDEAQLQIYTLMHRDSYPRFINSIMYKKLAQIPMSNSRKSSS